MRKFDVMGTYVYLLRGIKLAAPDGSPVGQKINYRSRFFLLNISCTRRIITFNVLEM